MGRPGPMAGDGQAGGFAFLPSALPTSVLPGQDWYPALPSFLYHPHWTYLATRTHQTHPFCTNLLY